MIPALDPVASHTAGADLETLGQIPGAQAPRDARWTLSTTALDHLWSVRKRGMLGGAARGSAASKSLRSAGLVNAFGAPTDDGSTITSLLETPSAVVRVEARHRGGISMWGTWSRDGVSLVRSGVAVPELVSDRVDDLVRLDVLPTGLAIGRLVGWLGLRPTWRFGTETVTLASEVLDGRIDDPDSLWQTSPVTDDEFTRSWSNGHWAEVWGYGEASGRGFRIVTSPGGAFERTLDTSNGMSELRPVSNERVLHLLVGMYVGS